MTERAPGLDPPRSEGGCFNCGSQEHFAYACPEPTRKEPYGAEVFRQRQAAKSTHGNGGRGSPNDRSKGLVITRYAPPPQYPPPPNAWGTVPPSGPYPPPAQPPYPYPQQPPLPYPPASQGQPPYPPPYQTGHPPVGGYGPPVPPPPVPGPTYGPYGQGPYPPPPPPLSSYGPPGPYGPASYPPHYQPPNPVYPPAPPPSFQGQLPQAPAPPTYASGYGANYPPGPPPPPLASYPPASYAPGSGYETPGPYPSYPIIPHQGWQPSSNGPGLPRHRDHRDRRNGRDKGGKNKHLGRGNDKHPRGRDRRPQFPSQRSSSNSRQRSPQPSSITNESTNECTTTTESTNGCTNESPKESTETTRDNGSTAPTATPGADVADEEKIKPDDLDEDFTWDLEKAFVNLEAKPADPVGKPLAADWNDDPTIPPAYNAKCIKSACFDPETPDACLVSVRDTKHWPTVKRDPIFRFRRRMVVIRLPGSSHEYFTYQFSRQMGPEWLRDREIVPVPSDPSLNDAIKRSTYQAGAAAKEGQALWKSAWESARKDINNKRSLDDTEGLKRSAKRIRNSVGRDFSPAPKPTRKPSPQSLDLNGDTWAPQSGETRNDTSRRPDSRDESSRGPSGYRLHRDRFTPFDSAERHDSGYQSGDKPMPYRDRSDNRHLVPPPSRLGRDNDRSRDRDREARARSPSYAKARSRTRSPTPVSVDSDTESADLSDLEYELLGMERPEKKKVASPKPTVKRRQVKVNAAFGRRW